MRYFKIKTHRTRLAAGLRPNPLGSSPRPPSWIYGEGKGRHVKDNVGKRSGGKEGKGGEG